MKSNASLCPELQRKPTVVAMTIKCSVSHQTCSPYIQFMRIADTTNIQRLHSLLFDLWRMTKPGLVLSFYGSDPCSPALVSLLQNSLGKITRQTSECPLHPLIDFAVAAWGRYSCHCARGFWGSLATAPSLPHEDG